MAKAKPLDALIEDWLEDAPSRPRRWLRAAKGVWYNRVPRSLRFWPALHFLLRHAFAAAAPFVALYYGSIGEQTAYVAAVGLFIASAVVAIIGLIADRKSHPDETEALVRFGDLLSSLKTAPASSAKRGEAINACLGIIEIFGRRIAKADERLSVSLVVYEGSSTTRMTIRHRNPGNTRAIGCPIDADSLLGHHSCQKDASPRVVHDTRGFKGLLKSPTQSSLTYRSIMIVPVLSGGPGERKTKGFVSIDCSHPYAFYGNRSDQIVVNCRPVIDQLSVLLMRE